MVLKKNNTIEQKKKAKKVKKRNVPERNNLVYFFVSRNISVFFNIQYAAFVKENKRNAL